MKKFLFSSVPALFIALSACGAPIATPAPIQAPTAVATKAPEAPPKPTDVMVKPSEVMTKPADVMVKPGEVMTKPADVMVKPGEVMTKPSDAMAKPGEVMTKPADVMVKPGEVMTKPADAMVKPGEVMTKPSDLMVKPGEVMTKPADIMVKPGDVMTKPSDAMAKPGEAMTVLGSGAFYPVGYKGSGQAKLVKQGEKTTLQFENFSVETGPDLVVWLVPGDPVAKGGAGVIQNGLLVGKLRAISGNQSYEIPAGTDLSRYKSVVIWCREFNVSFVAAPLKAA